MEPQTNTQVQHLYEIPSCTVCLNQLTQNLVSLSCGHIFHMNCICQHFQYKLSCPNCQKRAYQKELRIVVYPIVRNTQSTVLMKKLMGNFTESEKQQMQTLIKEYQTVMVQNQRYKNQIEKLNKQLQTTKRRYNIEKSQTAKRIYTLEQDQKKVKELKKVIQHFQIQTKRLQNQNLDLGVKVKTYEQTEREYQKIKQLKKIMNQNSKSLVEYKNELQKQNTSSEQMAKLFFDMIMIKNLDVLKLKRIIDDYPEKTAAKQQQIETLNIQLDRQRKQSHNLNEKRNTERKKYEELKLKYRTLLDKYKAVKDLSQPQDIYEDSLLSKPLPLKKTEKISIQSTNKFEQNSQLLKNNNKISTQQTKLTTFVSKINDEQKQFSDSHSFPRKKTVNDNILNASNKGGDNSRWPIHPQGFQPKSFKAFGGIVQKKKAEPQKGIILNNLFK